MSLPRHQSRPVDSRGPGPIVLVPPLLALVLGILWVRHGNGFRPRGDRPFPPQSALETQVPGWVGQAEPTGGTRLDVRLVSLHDQADRQRFDRDALAGRLGLEGGQPWRLVLRYSADPAAAVPALPLDGLELNWGDGKRLLPAVSTSQGVSEDVGVDPLRSLLALPETLAPNHDVTVVVWGDTPGQDLRLDVGSTQVQLRAEPVAAGTVPPTLARLDRSSAR